MHEIMPTIFSVSWLVFGIWAAITRKDDEGLWKMGIICSGIWAATLY